MKKEDFQTFYFAQNKIFAHLDRVNEWIKEGKTKPIMIEIDPTNICISKCPGCAGNRFCPKASLSLSFMKKIIDQISPFCKGLVFTGGGEPLCNSNTIKAVEYAKAKGINVGFITNGLLLDEAIAKKLLKNCTWIRVSVDAFNWKEYKLVHGLDKEYFERLWKNIKLLAKLKKKLNSSCTTGLGYLVNAKNKSSMVSFTKLSKRIGVDYVQFKPFHYGKADFLNELKECKSFESKNFKISAVIHRIFKKEGEFTSCFRDEFTTVIAADGKLYPCCFTRGMNEFCIGDLNKNSFLKLWNSSKRQKISKNKLKSRNCPIMCKYDPLNKFLWEVYKINKEGLHINFV